MQSICVLIFIVIYMLYMSISTIGDVKVENDSEVDEIGQQLSSGEKKNTNPINPVASKQIEWITVLRAFACLAVIMIHVIGFSTKNVDSESLVNYGTLRKLFNEVLIQPFISFAVPCFIMISGFLLLDPKRDVTIKKLVKKIIRMLCVFFIFGFFYSLCFWNDLSELRFYNIHQYILESISSFFNNKASYYWNTYFWYIIVLIGLYVLTPILRKFVEHSDKPTIQFVLIALFITTSIIPDINFYFNLNFVSLSQVGKCVFLYLLGYYIPNYNFIKDKYIYIAGCIGLIGYLITAYFQVAEQQSVFMILESAMIIKLFSNNKIKIKSNKIINCISKYSFGIYLIHPFCLWILANFKIYFTAFPFIIGEFLFFAYALIVSLFISMVLYRVPLIKKIFKS